MKCGECSLGTITNRVAGTDVRVVAVCPFSHYRREYSLECECTVLKALALFARLAKLEAVAKAAIGVAGMVYFAGLDDMLAALAALDDGGGGE